ncbi:uncharacterized protein LOC124664075 [Lolium rigidum]|uniref:uncharacterized protein LOC124664075 n=1 Tax=Lolium rigidum TaxID=89674 RepID=UPI001F5C4438|nr:uncharacterized protein LOC124664075 [Lolium rigidum]
MAPLAGAHIPPCCSSVLPPQWHVSISCGEMPHTSRPHSRISSSLMNLDVRAALVWEAAWPRQKDQTESSVEGSKKEGTIFRVDYCCSGLITTSTKLCSLLSSRSGAVHAQDGLDGAAATGHNYLSTEGNKGAWSHEESILLCEVIAEWNMIDECSFDFCA